MNEGPCGWRVGSKKSEDLGETGVAGGARLPALGRIGVRDLGVCPENNGITFRVIMGWHLGHSVQGCC